MPLPRLNFVKRLDYATPIRYGFTRQCLVLAGGVVAVALNQKRQIWRLHLAEPIAGPVLDLRPYSPAYQRWQREGDSFCEDRLSGGALFAYGQGFGVVFIDQVLLFATPNQPEPVVLDILGPQGEARDVVPRFSSRAGAPGVACWLPATGRLAVAYGYVQAAGMRTFLNQLVPHSATAFRQLQKPQALAMGPELAHLRPSAVIDQAYEHPHVQALRAGPQGLEVAASGGHYSSGLAADRAGALVLAIAPDTTEAMHIVERVPSRLPSVVFSAEGQMALWNQYSPATQGGIYCHELATGLTTRLGFRQKAFTTGLFHDQGEMLKWIKFGRAGNYIWVFSTAGSSVFEVLPTQSK